jgi:hypothetical protein
MTGSSADVDEEELSIIYLDRRKRFGNKIIVISEVINILAQSFFLRSPLSDSSNFLLA